MSGLDHPSEKLPPLKFLIHVRACSCGSVANDKSFFLGLWLNLHVPIEEVGVFSLKTAACPDIPLMSELMF